jgi:hypothetical protein
VRRALTHARRASEAVAARKDGAAAARTDINFSVERIRVFASDPPIYELQIEGRTMMLSTVELLAVSRFRTRFVDVLRRVPELPSASAAWRALVNEWLERAETVEQPPEASDDLMLNEEILRATDSLALGETAADLDQGKALQRDDLVFFKARSIRRLLKDTYADVSAHMVCRHLRSLGFESRVLRIDEQCVRVWTRGARANTPAAAVTAEPEPPALAESP